MRTGFRFVVAGLLLFPVPAAAQPHAFPVWERPAVGVFLGGSANADVNSGLGSPEATFVFDAPVVFGWRVRADASRVAWRFGPRGYTDQASDMVTVKSVRLGVVRVRQGWPHGARYVGGGYGAYHYGYSRLPLHNPWRGGVHAVAGMEATTTGHRYAFNGELRLHAIDGTGQGPVFSAVLFKLDAALGMKVRF